eukprot:9394253-Pyramimonas_sp.AAC.1
MFLSAFRWASDLVNYNTGNPPVCDGRYARIDVFPFGEKYAADVGLIMQSGERGRAAVQVIRTHVFATEVAEGQ